MVPDYKPNEPANVYIYEEKSRLVIFSCIPDLTNYAVDGELLYSYSLKLVCVKQLVFQVTLIAQGDVPLSIVMTVCTTLGAVLLTPLLTKILAGAYVPIDALGLSISTLQVGC